MMYHLDCIEFEKDIEFHVFHKLFPKIFLLQKRFLYKERNISFLNDFIYIFSFKRIIENEKNVPILLTIRKT